MNQRDEQPDEQRDEPRDQERSEVPDEQRQEAPESERRVRGRPGTDLARKRARESDARGAVTDGPGTGPDPEEQSDFSGVEKKLDEPFEDD